MTEVTDEMRDAFYSKAEVLRTGSIRYLDDALRAALECSPQVKETQPPSTHVEGRTFQLGDMVRKRSGSWWEGRVVGFYSTEQTLDGVCVQMDKPMGPVQIYPASTLAALATTEGSDNG